MFLFIHSDDFLILSFIIETLNVAGVVVGILVPLLIVVVLMVLVAVLAISYRKQLHCKYRRWKSKKYGPKDDPKETTEVVVLSDKRPITVPSDSEIVMPKTCPLPSSISSVSNVYKGCMHHILNMRKSFSALLAVAT